MRYPILISLLLSTIVGCKNSYNEHDEDEWGNEFCAQFDSAISNLYKTAEINKLASLKLADSLIKKYEIEDTVLYDKSSVKQLHYFKGEIYYKTNDYKSALKEFSFDTIWDGNAICRASAYIKLNKPKEAYKELMAVGKGFYLYDYVWGNYFEAVGNKKEAIQIYQEIKQDKSIKHYAYYKLAVERLDELTKNNSILLNEIYLPTENPKFEICDSDNKNRTKIFQIIAAIPEVKKCKKCNSTWIYESPQENDQNYYWIKVGQQDGLDNMITMFDLYVYVETFDIKYFDKQNKKILSLYDWRSQNKKWSQKIK
jgi:hypothetical protein